MSLLTLAIATLAAILLLTSASRFTAMGWQAARSSLLSRQWRTKLQSELSREALHARMASELHAQTEMLKGESWSVLEVVEIVDEADDCRSFYLQDPLGRLPDFKPGQFVTVRPALGGFSLPARCYSLSDAPGLPWWRITVKRQQQPSSPLASFSPSLSNWLHDRLRLGDCLLVNGPYGDFVLDLQSTEPIALLSAGIGVTPLVSMLKTQLATNPQRSVNMFLQCQDVQHWPFGELVHNWSEECSHLSVHSYFSRASDVPVVNAGTTEIGKFSASNVLAALDRPAETHFYLCGPDAWMTNMIQSLLAQSMEPSRIHSESFGNGSNHTPSAPADVEPWSIRFSDSDQPLVSGTERKSIWQAAKEQVVELPAACHSGACGTCRIKLLAGKVAYSVKPTCSVNEGDVLACIAQPVGDVVVQASSDVSSSASHSRMQHAH